MSARYKTAESDDDPSISYFSTRTVPRALRLEYWHDILRQSLWPVTEWSQLPQEFAVELKEASLGCMSSVWERISPHTARRTKTDVDNTRECCYHLFVNMKAWMVDHQGHSTRLAPEDVLLLARGEHITRAPTGFQGVILKCSADWMRTWLPVPEALAGRAIGRGLRWGRALSLIISQLTPELVTDPPLPRSVLIDQVGSLLSLIAGDAVSRATPELCRKIKDYIYQRCAESALTAEDIAASLNLPTQLVHRTLASRQLTLASVLLEARLERGLQMLTSPSFGDRSVIDIARLAGFTTAGHFVRVIRKRTGRTPFQIQRAAHT